jgi:hypothetical protein
VTVEQSPATTTAVVRTPVAAIVIAATAETKDQEGDDRHHDQAGCDANRHRITG